MTMRTHLPVAALLLIAPVAAHAQNNPHILLAATGGGFIGGLLGALLACWLCKRRESPKVDLDVRPPTKLS